MLAGKIFIVAVIAIMLIGLDIGMLTVSIKSFPVGVLVLGMLAIILYLAFFAVIPYASARAQNIVWNNTELGG